MTALEKLAEIIKEQAARPAIRAGGHQGKLFKDVTEKLKAPGPQSHATMTSISPTTPFARDVAQFEGRARAKREGVSLGVRTAPTVTTSEKLSPQLAAARGREPARNVVPSAQDVQKELNVRHGRPAPVKFEAKQQRQEAEAVARGKDVSQQLGHERSKDIATNVDKLRGMKTLESATAPLSPKLRKRLKSHPMVSERIQAGVLEASLKTHKALGDVTHAVTTAGGKVTDAVKSNVAAGARSVAAGVGAGAEAVGELGRKAFKATGDVVHAAAPAVAKVKNIAAAGVAAGSKAVGAAGEAVGDIGRQAFKATGDAAHAVKAKVKGMRDASAAQRSRVAESNLAASRKAQRSSSQVEDAPAPKSEPARATAGVTPWRHIAAAGGIGLVGAGMMRNQNDE